MEHGDDTTSSEIFYDQVAKVLEKDKETWNLLVEWVAVAFNDMLDDTPRASWSSFLTS